MKGLILLVCAYIQGLYVALAEVNGGAGLLACLLGGPRYAGTSVTRGGSPPDFPGSRGSKSFTHNTVHPPRPLQALEIHRRRRRVRANCKSEYDEPMTDCFHVELFGRKMVHWQNQGRAGRQAKGRPGWGRSELLGESSGVLRPHVQRSYD